MRQAFEYHTLLHHSQTSWLTRVGMVSFEYHTFLHHSQTVVGGTVSTRGLSTIHFYIILKQIRAQR